MIPVVRNNLDKIVNTCKQMEVKSLYLTGSGAREVDYKTESDLDFVFRFKKDVTGLNLAKYDYFDLLFTLEEITGKKIDLIAEEKIRKEKVKIYES